MNDMAKNLILWVIIAIVLMSVFNNFTSTQSKAQSLAYSDFLEEVLGQRRSLLHSSHLVELSGDHSDPLGVENRGP